MIDFIFLLIVVIVILLVIILLTSLSHAALTDRIIEEYNKGKDQDICNIYRYLGLKDGFKKDKRYKLVNVESAKKLVTYLQETLDENS